MNSNTTASHTPAQQQQMSQQQPPSYAPPAYPPTAQTATGQMPLQSNNPYYQQQPQANWGPGGQGQWQGPPPPPPPQAYGGYYGYNGMPPQGMRYGPPQSMGGGPGVYGQGPGGRPVTEGDACCAGFLAAMLACCCLEAIF